MPLGIGIYASRRYLENNPQPQHLVLWNDDIELPEWASANFPSAQVAIRANDVTTLLACLSHDMGVTMLPCYIGETDPALWRLDLPLAPSNWGVWVLSHADLRATARVRVCREFLADIIDQQRPLIAGLKSTYWRG